VIIVGRFAQETEGKLYKKSRRLAAVAEPPISLISPFFEQNGHRSRFEVVAEIDCESVKVTRCV